MITEEAGPVPNRAQPVQESQAVMDDITAMMEGVSYGAI